MTGYIFKKYDDNLNEEKLAKISPEQLKEVYESCEANGGGMCEVCRTYKYEVERREVK